MRPSRLHAKTHSAGEAGFSIWEAIVSAGLLTVSTVAIMGVFNSSITSVNNINTRDASFAAINADMVEIQRLNDYYTCAPGSCGVADLGKEPPNEFEYAPDPDGVDSAAFSTFAALCKNIPSNLSQALVDRLEASPTITANGGSITITRTARLHPDNGSDRHLYIVEWIPTQGAKTQIILSPTVSRWCP
jgi:hypothetical protein